MTDIKSLTLDELKKEMEALGEKSFRAAQIYKWLHVKLVHSFDEMTDLSVALRDKLKASFSVTDEPPEVTVNVLSILKKGIMTPSATRSSRCFARSSLKPRPSPASRR